MLSQQTHLQKSIKQILVLELGNLHHAESSPNKLTLLIP